MAEPGWGRVRLGLRSAEAHRHTPEVPRRALQKDVGGLEVAVHQPANAAQSYVRSEAGGSTHVCSGAGGSTQQARRGEAKLAHKPTGQAVDNGWPLERAQNGNRRKGLGTESIPRIRMPTPLQGLSKTHSHDAGLVEHTQNSSRVALQSPALLSHLSE